MVRDHVEKQLKKWFPKRSFDIGMDTALLIGEPSVLATGLILDSDRNYLGLYFAGQ